MKAENERKQIEAAIEKEQTKAGKGQTRKQKRKARREEERKATELRNELHALVSLAGENFKDYGSNALMDKILKAIEDVTSSNPNTVLRGRTADNLRINYYPASQHITGVRNRMCNVLSVELDYNALERLLYPPACSIQEALGVQYSNYPGYRRLDKRTYRSVWIHNQKLYNEIHPITWPKRDAVISAVVEAMRERCKRVDPKSILLRGPLHLKGTLTEDERKHVQEGSLYGLHTGLAGKVRTCFQGPQLRAKEYEDVSSRCWKAIKGRLGLRCMWRKVSSKPLMKGWKQEVRSRVCSRIASR